MKKFTVLWLDHFGEEIEAKCRQSGLNVSFHVEPVYGDPELLYKPTESTFAFIRRETRDHDLGAIVIGNLLGAGLLKAKHVPTRLREKTIIALSSGTKREIALLRRRYVALGYSQIVMRPGLIQYLKNMLTAD